MVALVLLKQLLVLLKQVLVLLLEAAPVLDIGLVLLRVRAIVRGQELLLGLARDAQLLTSLLADRCGRGTDRNAVTGTRHDITATPKAAGVPADPRACLEGLLTPRAVVADGNDHPRANAERYDDGGCGPPFLGTPRTPSGASQS